jgi:phage tail-like protein
MGTLEDAGSSLLAAGTSLVTSMLGTYPVVGFHFKLIFLPELDSSFPLIPETSFFEVSGISLEMGTEEIQEGGVNNYRHQVPTGRKHQNLVLKRGFTVNKALTSWCRSCINRELDDPIDTKSFTVMLLNEYRIPIKSWTFKDAWPVKWELSPFDSKKNEVVVESIEFAYSISDAI